MKTVLLIAYYFPPMGMGGVQRSAKFVSYLPDFGWNPKVITVKPVVYYAYDSEMTSSLSSEDIFRTDSFDPGRIASFFIKSNTINKKNSYPKNRFANNLNRWLAFPDTKIGWIPFAYRKAERLIRQGNIDIVLTTSPPLSAHMVGLRLKRKFNIPWIADFRDYWAAPNIREYPTRVHKWFNLSLERRILKNADHITVVSGDIREQCLRTGNIPAERCSILTNGFDKDDYPESVEKSTEKFLIVHAGTLNSINEPGPFLNALDIVIKKQPEFAKEALFIQVGRWFQKIEMLTGISEKVLELINDLGYLSHRESLKTLSRGDLLLFPLSDVCPPGWISGRLFEYLPLTSPILGIIPEGEAADLIRKYQRGKVVHPHEPENIADTILDYYKIWKEKRSNSERQITADSNFIRLDVFSRKKITKLLADKLDRLTS